MSMYLHVVQSYQRWAERGYCTKLTCRHHPYMELIIYVDHEGIHLRCPFDDYSYILSSGEYAQLEKKIAFAKLLFERQ